MAVSIDCFILFVCVFFERALLFGVYIRAPVVQKLPVCKHSLPREQFLGTLH